MAPATLCIFEPKWKGGGHHPSWFKEIVAQWLILGHRVVAFCPATAEVEAALKGRLSATELSRLTLHQIPDQRDLLGRWARSPLRMFRGLWMAGKYGRILKESLGGMRLPSGTRVFFGLTDLFALRVRGFGRLAASRFSHPFVGLYFFPPLRARSFPASMILDDLGFFRGAACKGVMILNEDLRADLQSRLGKPVWVLPDFIASDAARTRDEDPVGGVVEKVREVAGGRRIVLLAGDISPRKGVLAFLDLAEQCRGLPWYFVVAGHIHRDAFTGKELERIDASAGSESLFLHLERIKSDQEFHALVAAADVLYAAYPDFPHSSNQLIQCAVHQVPILVADGYLMARRVKAFHLGAAFPYGDLEAMVGALHSLIEADDGWRSAFRSGCREYCGIHSAERFAKEVAGICAGQNSWQ